MCGLCVFFVFSNKKFKPVEKTTLICVYNCTTNWPGRKAFAIVLNFITDPDEDPRYWYNLAGVVVHTGTADGGHYYSFIRDRYSTTGSWYLFNDAEVKPFDPSQIAAECFGGEMMVSQNIMIFALF